MLMDDPRSVVTLPRAIGTGIHWLGGCIEAEFSGRTVHTHVSCFTVQGSSKVLMVDTGHPKDWAEIDAHLDEVLGSRGVDYIFPTHAELPHAGNLPRLFEKYPASLAIGDVRDYHLYYPEHESRFEPRLLGDTIDLGGRRFHILTAVIRDLPSTYWGFDDLDGLLFVSDGYSYTHEHEAGQCALLAEELPHLPTPKQARFINERALYWTRFRNMNPYLSALEDLRKDLGVRMIAPAHGGVIADPARVLPALESGY